MDGVLATTVDKFTFRVPIDRLYTVEGVWAKTEGNLVRVGVADFVQQRSGDVAFAEPKPAGTRLARGDEMATIETIKVTIIFGSPVSGEVTELNPKLATNPEAINQDPYGAGWLAIIRPNDWEGDKLQLLEPQAYFESMKLEAEQEVKRQ